MARIITITSGKGGVGKTSISLNLCLELAASGYRVCLFDGDLGLANINILTGIYPEKDLSAVITGQAQLNEIIIKNYQGIDIIPGSSGVEKLADLGLDESAKLIRAFLSLEQYDFFIFDTSAGISSQVISFCLASNEIILVITTEPTSLTDAYSLLKILSKNRYANPVNILINQVKKIDKAQSVYSQLKDTVNKFLAIKIEPLGIVVSDKHVGISVISQTPFSLVFPDAKASLCIREIKKRLLHRHGSGDDISMDKFWNSFLMFLSNLKNVNLPENQEIKTEDTDPRQTEAGIVSKLTAVEAGIAALLDELKTIKQLLVVHKEAKKEKKQPIPASNKPPEIILDFEAWLAKRVS